MEKQYKATQKYLIESPRKIRLVVEIIKKMSPLEAIEKLPFVGKRASEALGKVIKAAIANARVQSASDTNLIFKEIQVGEGPRLKRGRAASRGRYHPYKKRMSHIRVILVEKKSDVKIEAKKETTAVIKEAEVVKKKSVKGKK